MMFSRAQAQLAATDARFGIQADGSLIDQAGQRMVIERPFRRIISLYAAHTENLFDLGLNAEIIGVSRADRYPAAVDQRPRFSPRDDPERFLAARPDLVLIRPMIARTHAGLVERLAASGIAVISMQPGTLQDMYRYWEALGALTGRRERAQAMRRQFEAELERITALTRHVAVRPRVYFESIHDKFKTFSPDAMPIMAVQAAGGVNVAEDAEPVRATNIAAYGKERLLAKGDQIDVYLAQRGPMNHPTLEQIVGEPGFGLIRAVRQARVHIVDETVVARPTRRLVIGIRAIGHILYPDLFAAAPGEADNDTPEEDD
jgi:iron complex transport system substrate-binding protein